VGEEQEPAMRVSVAVVMGAGISLMILGLFLTGLQYLGVGHGRTSQLDARHNGSTATLDGVTHDIHQGPGGDGLNIVVQSKPVTVPDFGSIVAVSLQESFDLGGTLFRDTGFRVSRSFNSRAMACTRWTWSE
jgi:hypothetical protein